MALTKAAFDGLERLAYPRGPHTAELLDKQNVRLLAILERHDTPRFAAIMGGLNGWVHEKLLKEKIRTFVRDAKKFDTQVKAENDLKQKLGAAEADGRPPIAVGNPVQIAKDFVAQCRPNLIRVDEQWLDYQVNCYVPLEDREMRALVQDHMAGGVNAETGEDCNPSLREVTEVVEALANITFRSNREAEPPTWLTPDPSRPDPRMVIAARNGLLDIGAENLMPHTPNFFTRNGLEHDYLEPWACDLPRTWLAFLESIWPEAEGGAANKLALQEMMGHLLTADTKYQRIFLLVGAPNAGKGVIARVIEALVGTRNVVSQSVTKLGTDFGLKALLGKTVFIVPDLRLGKGTNIGGITEVLLNISGEDALNIGRKFEDDVQARLTARVVLFANMELTLPDQSGAMRRRLYPLVFHKTFADRPDLALTDKLLAELPAILNWSLEGLRRLEARRDPETGRQLGFVLTEEGKRMVDSIARRGSPVHTFLRDACELVPGAVTPKTTLYQVFEAWCLEGDESSYHTEEMFGRELRVASGFTVDTSRPWIDGKRVRSYTGVKLKPTWEHFGY